MPIVTFLKTGNSINLPNHSSLIDLEDSRDNEVSFGCQSAACGTCLIDVVSGMQNISLRNEDEQDLLETLDLDDEKLRLACQCVVHGDIIINPQS
ncbi:2Fe-2S iron-sulfur cluster-binding protein [Candidatus Enterovibrio altilux]|uniref:Ferredoxin n=1 Tax=Candidatus Enterovibrio altilux TaxID=1927128 RepID=A0A291B7X5_9GAMM|nr:2Fe-2S iron-sulfur cluster binding domain-containing protein [Candidatus Enterovibrio luxaltus]ATF09095.1 Ferredoxin [Candidatus Enterovibrio luxaltus]